MKVVTFNIRCDYGQDGLNEFANRKELILRKINQEKPDIIGFQEVLLSLPKGCPLLPNYKKEQRKSRSCVITIDYPLLLFFCYSAVFYYILQRFSCQALFHFNLIKL